MLQLSPGLPHPLEKNRSWMRTRQTIVGLFRLTPAAATSAATGFCRRGSPLAAPAVAPKPAAKCNMASQHAHPRGNHRFLSLFFIHTASSRTPLSSLPPALATLDSGGAPAKTRRGPGGGGRICGRQHLHHHHRRLNTSSDRVAALPRPRTRAARRHLLCPVPAISSRKPPRLPKRRRSRPPPAAEIRHDGLHGRLLLPRRGEQLVAEGRGGRRVRRHLGGDGGADPPLRRWPWRPPRLLLSFLGGCGVLPGGFPTAANGLPRSASLLRLIPPLRGMRVRCATLLELLLFCSTRSCRMWRFCICRCTFLLEAVLQE
jgi:hypothetical protein